MPFSFRIVANCSSGGCVCAWGEEAGARAGYRLAAPAPNPAPAPYPALGHSVQPSPSQTGHIGSQIFQKGTIEYISLDRIKESLIKGHRVTIHFLSLLRSGFREVLEMYQRNKLMNYICRLFAGFKIYSQINPFLIYIPEVCSGLAFRESLGHLGSFPNLSLLLGTPSPSLN